MKQLGIFDEMQPYFSEIHTEYINKMIQCLRCGSKYET